MNRVVGTHDIALITLDTLRYDVAVTEMARGHTPNLARLLGAWEERHSPGSFTFAAHAAFFAGFLPTPARPGRHPRLFAARFAGSETTAGSTWVFDAPDLVTGLRAQGYHTACIGGVGFFNKQSPLGSVFPALFDESHWSPSLGVTEARSTEHQVALATSILARVPAHRRVFLFLNISALHQPNKMYLPGAEQDSIESHAAALAYVDAQIPPLFEALTRRGPSLAILCSDHGTLYGDDGHHGHRVGHPAVWTVPYAEVLLPEIPR
ncbi:MAG: STM4013/SEN3800 family hydrolase [Byssovorax sp.]